MLRRKLLLFITCLFYFKFAFTQVCKGKQAILIEEAFCNNSPYYLRFEDNFDGSELDTSKWVITTGVPRDETQSIAQQWYSEKCVVVNDGVLKLSANRDTLLNQCFNAWINNANKTLCNDFFFTAGEIKSKQKFSHGKFEISCKLPKGKGLGMAFWMYGFDAQNEIDVFEFRNENNLFEKVDPDKLSKVPHMNSRTDYEGDGKIEDCSSHYSGSDFSVEFHTFAVVWDQFKIEWLVDGKSKRVSTLFYTLAGQPVDCEGLHISNEYLVNRAFPRNPMEVYLSFGIFSGKGQPDNDLVLPVDFEIDYLRYYSQ